ncbi:hypothetical protein CDEST_01317 [Colletotrichum destructivum]|uniref:Uncharacterized protein n=1 Tax=Colletotrichum destructivum TaxID=34406 RepID=A0AAX4HZP7_9PEZI|nr:hypothetical protein CDEST_01317 [Colletotrichum destructivum]
MTQASSPLGHTPVCFPTQIFFLQQSFISVMNLSSNPTPYHQRQTITTTDLHKLKYSIIQKPCVKFEFKKLRL